MCAQGDIPVPLTSTCAATDALLYPNGVLTNNDDDPLAKFDRRMGFDDVERDLRDMIAKLDKEIANKQVL